MGLCFLHDDPEVVPDPWMLEHLRVVHPDAYGDGPEQWPDGELVVIDTTLDSDDFGGAS